LGTPLEPRLVKAALPMIPLHDLRHSCATLLLAQGVNPRVVMETLGHSQISLTLNTHSHVLPSLQREAAAKIDAVFSGS
jgi:integrase